MRGPYTIPLMVSRLPGVLLFLPVPLVLALFTRFPLGVDASLSLGAALMLTHRLYARPFALARATTRCLWCAGRAGDGPALELREPFGTTAWRACTPAHAQRLRRTFGWAAGHATVLKAGILGALALFLAGALASARGATGALTPADWSAFFRLAIAASVLPLGLLAPSAEPIADELPRVPFPVHIQALVGTWAVLWLFRLVGVAWLVLGLWHVAARLDAV